MVSMVLLLRYSWVFVLYTVHIACIEVHLLYLEPCIRLPFSTPTVPGSSQVHRPGDGDEGNVAMYGRSEENFHERGDLPIVC